MTSESAPFIRQKGPLPGLNNERNISCSEENGLHKLCVEGGGKLSDEHRDALVLDPVPFVYHQEWGSSGDIPCPDIASSATNKMPVTEKPRSVTKTASKDSGFVPSDLRVHAELHQKTNAAIVVKAGCDITFSDPFTMKKLMEEPKIQHLLKDVAWRNKELRTFIQREATEEKVKPNHVFRESCDVQFIHDQDVVDKHLLVWMKPMRD